MSFAQFIQRSREEHILFSAMVELTYRCNWDCFFCYNDRQLQGKPMGVADYRRFFEDLATMGTMNLTLTGGEPLVHPDFFTIGGMARELGFLTRVKTNAHALRGRVLERFLAEVAPYSIDVSLHGATAAVHDRQTRLPGSFDGLLETLPILRDRGLRIRVNGTLTRWNEHQIEAMYALMEGLGLDLVLQADVTPRDDGDTTPLDIAPSPAAVSRLLEIQRRRREAAAPVTPPPAPTASPVATTKHCAAGSAMVTVDPYGNVYPCVQLRRRIGNLHEHGIAHLWRHSTALEEVREENREVKRMLDRERAAGRPVDNYCPGTAQAQTGSPLVFHPHAKLRQKLQGELEQK